MEPDDMVEVCVYFLDPHVCTMFCMGYEPLCPLNTAVQGTSKEDDAAHKPDLAQSTEGLVCSWLGPAGWGWV